MEEEEGKSQVRGWKVINFCSSAVHFYFLWLLIHLLPLALDCLSLSLPPFLNQQSQGYNSTSEWTVTFPSRTCILMTDKEGEAVKSIVELWRGMWIVISLEEEDARRQVMECEPIWQALLTQRSEILAAWFGGSLAGSGRALYENSQLRPWRHCAGMEKWNASNLWILGCPGRHTDCSSIHRSHPTEEII